MIDKKVSNTDDKVSGEIKILKNKWVKNRSQLYRKHNERHYQWLNKAEEMVSKVEERAKETLHSDINKETPKYCHKTQEHGYDQKDKPKNLLGRRS